MTTTIIANPKNINAIVSLGNDDLGAADVESQVVEVSEYETSSGELVSEVGTFILPGDAFRDKPMLDWVLSRAGEDEETFDDFNDLMV